MTMFARLAKAAAHAIGAVAAGLLAGCAPTPPIPDASDLARGRLPEPTVAVRIPGLGPCTDNPDRTLRFDARQPVAILVHGCWGSAGLFRGLAQVLAFHGQQAACFSYDDRDSMMKSSAELIAAVTALGRSLDSKAITLVGHSQGGLIARKALVDERADRLEAEDLRLRLVTVSGPFAGIAAASHCGDPAVARLTRGWIGPMCRVVTGDKWHEITRFSGFILEPGTLRPQVRDYIKVDTDERASCRPGEYGACAEPDLVFSLEEQRSAAVEGDPRARVEEVKAGHVEIVGDQARAPVKLIALLQRYGVILPTDPHRAEALRRLLIAVYGEPGDR